MTRFIVLLPILASCSVGSYGESGDDGGGDDGPSVADKDICVDRVATPAIAHNHAAAGANPAGPRAGLGCMAVGGCHGAQPGSTEFGIAGTAYKEAGAAATTAAAGATIRLFPTSGADMNKSLAKAVTDSAGNFYIYKAMTPTFPAAGLVVDIADCSATPNTIVPMLAPIRANEGNCSSSDSCHITPGPQPIFILGG